MTDNPTQMIITCSESVTQMLKQALIDSTIQFLSVFILVGFRLFSLTFPDMFPAK